MSAVRRAYGLVLALSAVWAPALAAQSPAERAASCVSAGGDPALCAAGVVSARQVAGQIGLMAGPGSEIPGEGSTLGRRLGGMPRVAAWVRAGIHPFGVPAPVDPNGPDDQSTWTPSVQAGLGLGVFDGFQLLPTVGGVLSLDVVGQASFLFLSGGSDFDGHASVVSVGGRVGLLRESFTLPGVSVSVVQRFSGVVGLGETTGGDAVELLTDPSVRSLRVTVSKDLFALGVLAGVGWDDIASDTALRVSDGGAGSALSDGSLDASRKLYFVSVTKQLGVLTWMTVEGGWATGFDTLAGYTGGFDPEGSTRFVSVSLLLKL